MVTMGRAASWRTRRAGLGRGRPSSGGRWSWCNRSRAECWAVAVKAQLDSRRQTRACPTRAAERQALRNPSVHLHASFSSSSTTSTPPPHCYPLPSLFRTIYSIMFASPAVRRALDALRSPTQPSFARWNAARAEPLRLPPATPRPPRQLKRYRVHHRSLVLHAPARRPAASYVKEAE